MWGSYMYRYISDTEISTNFILLNFGAVLVFLYNFFTLKKKQGFMSKKKPNVT